MASRQEQSLEGLGKALARLEEALDIPHPNSLIVDGTIQRFEFVTTLYWETLKRLLAEEGIDAPTPKETLKQAFQIKWLDDETAWLQMLKDRNETSHVYDEKTALRIYKNIQKNFPELKQVYAKLAARYKK
jgi:nucleotidyltransferase substrate binding protein (TIGR01987 family)